MILQIKNMVCPRCLKSVKSILNELKIDYYSIELGRVELSEPLTENQLSLLSSSLLEKGFELLESKETKLINQVKIYIIEKFHYGKHNINSNISIELGKLLNQDYSAISKTFSKVEGITIEHYAMHQRIEKVKELLSYGEMNISEIAFELGFSSVAHLSGQFKKLTGMTPSAFKKLLVKPRNPINDL